MHDRVSDGFSNSVDVRLDSFTQGLINDDRLRSRERLSTEFSNGWLTAYHMIGWLLSVGGILSGVGCLMLKHHCTASTLSADWQTAFEVIGIITICLGAILFLATSYAMITGFGTVYRASTVVGQSSSFYQD